MAGAQPNFGATASVSARDSTAVDKVKDLTKGGADYVLELAGFEHPWGAAYRMTHGGEMTVTAGLRRADHRWPARMSIWWHRNAREGSEVGSCVPVCDLPLYLGLYLAGKLRVDKLMGERLALNQINRGFDRLATGEALRDAF